MHSFSVVDIKVSLTFSCLYIWICIYFSRETSQILGIYMTLCADSILQQDCTWNQCTRQLHRKSNEPAVTECGITTRIDSKTSHCVTSMQVRKRQLTLATASSGQLATCNSIVVGVNLVMWQLGKAMFARSVAQLLHVRATEDISKYMYVYF